MMQHVQLRMFHYSPDTVPTIVTLTHPDADVLHFSEFFEIEDDDYNVHHADTVERHYAAPRYYKEDGFETHDMWVLLLSFGTEVPA